MSKTGAFLAPEVSLLFLVATVRDKGHLCEFFRQICATFRSHGMSLSETIAERFWSDFYAESIRKISFLSEKVVRRPR